MEAATVPVPVQAPIVWDPYEEEEYISLANPYDTILADPWSGVDNSDVGSDDEARDTKAHQVLRRLQSGQHDVYLANGIYMCPFCTRRLGGTDFNCVMRHAENVNYCNPKIGKIVNLDAFYTKHKVLGIHLRNLEQVAITEGRMRLIRPRRR